MRGPDSRPNSQIEALERENTSLRSVADHLGVGVWHLQHDGTTVYASPRMCELLEVADADQLQQCTASDFLDEESLLLLFVADPSARYDVILVGRRGTRRQVTMSSVVQIAGAGVQRAAIATFAEARSTTAPEPDALPMDLARAAAQMALFEWDIERNRVDSRFAGQSTVMDGSLKDAITRGLDDDHRNRIAAEIDAAVADPSRDIIHLEYQAKFPDGSKRWRMATARIMRDADGKAQRLAGASADISQLKHLQERLATAERMESLGRMAAGLAHEFNNLMTVIMGCASYARQAPANIEDAMDDIDAAAARAALMTQQLLTFARRQPMEHLPVDLRPLLERSCEWLRSALPERIELVANLATDIPLVDVDAALLEQVVMNLAANSRDAMPSGGTLTIALERTPTGLALTVADTGHGMDAHTLQHALEPFFTTKPSAAGLGLAAAYGIVAELGGDLTLRSTEGAGTTVEVRLPASGMPSERPGAMSRAPTARESLILIVDDEPAIRKVMEQCLTRSGYRVRLAATGAEALDLIDETVDMVISDIRMPGMNGSELAERLRAARPTLPILLMSGYSEHAVDRAEGTAFMAKPFELGRLLDVIESLLRR